VINQVKCDVVDLLTVLVPVTNEAQPRLERCVSSCHEHDLAETHQSVACHARRSEEASTASEFIFVKLVMPSCKPLRCLSGEMQDFLSLSTERSMPNAKQKTQELNS
jgi:hypothetical protein